MNYRTLTPDDVKAIQQRKLRELEAEHATLVLELHLAAVVGIENEQTAVARAHRDILDAQHAALMAALEPHADGGASAENSPD